MEQIDEICLKGIKIAKLIGICAELNFIFREKGVSLAKGLVLVLEEGVAEELSQSLVRNFGAVEMVGLKLKNNTVRNYQMAVHIYKRTDRENDIYDFLHGKTFLPVVIAEGVMPGGLRDISYGIRVNKKICTGVRRPEFAEEQQKIRKFVRMNPDLAVRELDLLQTSADFSRRTEYSSLFTGLMAALKIYKLFFRSSHSEVETALYFEEVAKEVEMCVEEADDFTEDYDAVDAIRDAIFRYLDLNHEWHIGDVRNVSGALDTEVIMGNAVLYDEQFYYFTEALLRRACGSVLGVLSFLKVKNMLRDEGIIVCNENAARNFTVKKVISRAHGITSRHRFIKIDKEFLRSPEGLFLEEWKEDDSGVRRKSGEEFMPDKR